MCNKKTKKLIRINNIIFILGSDFVTVTATYAMKMSGRTYAPKGNGKKDTNDQIE